MMTMFGNRSGKEEVRKWSNVFCVEPRRFFSLFLAQKLIAFGAKNVGETVKFTIVFFQ